MKGNCPDLFPATIQLEGLFETLEKEPFIKNINRKWLIFYILFQVVLFALFATIISPGFNNLNDFLSKLRSPSGFFPLLAFPLAIVLEGIIHRDNKVKLVYWKMKNPLPGSRAFTSIAPNDQRIDMAAVKALFPNGLPEAPQDQNASWYKLYRQYSNRPRVFDANRFFLLTRDMATLTAIIMPICAVLHLIWLTPSILIVYHFLILISLFILICFSAQNYGKQLIASVILEATITST